MQDSGIGRNRRPDKGLQARAKVKLDQIDAKLAELNTVRNILGAALDAGCDDLIACAQSPFCPLSITNPADAAERCDRGRHSARGDGPSRLRSGSR